MNSQTVNSVELSLVDRGEGPPLLLVHGFPLDHSMWDAQIDALAGEHRVIAPDLRGFGRSGVTRGTVSMQQFADDLDALLDALGIDRPITLCGLSMGGYAALEFWRKYRRRLRGLVLCDTRAACDTEAAVAARLQTAEQVLREGPATLVETMIPKLFAETTIKQRPELLDWFRRVGMATQPEGIAAALRGMASRTDFAAALGEIDCPVLVVVGQLDTLSTPQQMGRIARAIPGARLVEIPGGGHMAPMERPAEVTAALREFLAGL